MCNTNVTKEQLIDNYKKMKKKIGKIPKYDDMGKISEYCGDQYGSKFSSWNKFLVLMKDKQKEGAPTKEDLTDYYFKLKEKIGKKPNSKEFVKEFHSDSYRTHFKGWNNFLREIGELENYGSMISQEDLKDNYYNVKSKIGGIPRISDMKNKKISYYSASQYLIRFGSWNKFLQSVGEKQNRYFNVDVKKEDLIDNYYQIKRKLGKLPMCKDIKIKHGSKYGGSHYWKTFGSWRNFLRYIGETQKSGGKHLDEAISEFKKIYQNYKPTKVQLIKEHCWIFGHFRKNKLLDKYCKPPQRGYPIKEIIKSNNKNIKLIKKYKPKLIFSNT